MTELNSTTASPSHVDWSNSSILVTGGAGSLGAKFVQRMIEKYNLRRLTVLSRDELKQSEMKHRFTESENSPMRYFLGDVRDYNRLRRAFNWVDIVIHAAALKQVPAAEADPFEAVLTNIMGAKNVIDAAR
jgi:UDP-N-acetylglucosamine 4,6-dehydratase/5-epimerase